MRQIRSEATYNNDKLYDLISAGSIEDAEIFLIALAKEWQNDDGECSSDGFVNETQHLIIKTLARFPAYSLLTEIAMTPCSPEAAETLAAIAVKLNRLDMWDHARKLKGKMEPETWLAGLLLQGASDKELRAAGEAINPQNADRFVHTLQWYLENKVNIDRLLDARLFKILFGFAGSYARLAQITDFAICEGRGRKVAELAAPCPHPPLKLRMLAQAAADVPEALQDALALLGTMEKPEPGDPLAGILITIALEDLRPLTNDLAALAGDAIRLLDPPDRDICLERIIVALAERGDTQALDRYLIHMTNETIRQNLITQL